MHVRILAHRGCTGPDRIENTVSALQAGLHDGADGAELDLRLTADGVLAACHDADLRRLTGTTLEVAGSHWTALQRQADAAGIPLARVEWLLAAAGGSPLVLELKASPAPRQRVARAVVEELMLHRAAGLRLDVTLSSFDAALIRLVRIALPSYLGVRTALLGRPTFPATRVLRQARAAGHDQIHPHITDLLSEPSVVELAATAGLEVVPWTVNSRRAVRRCAELGVEAIITDHPRMARAALELRLAAA